MKFRPIIFSGEMVRAILDGRKSQTRRVIKFPKWGEYQTTEADWDVTVLGGQLHLTQPLVLNTANGRPSRAMQDKILHCPYGVPGDGLYVREEFAWPQHMDGHAPSQVDAEWGAQYPSHTRYRASQPERLVSQGRWRRARHMPRWASRLTRMVTDVRVEYVQDIITEDIIAEGLSTTLREHDAEVHLLDQFINLWDSINGKRPGRSWADNPLVRRVSFRRIEGDDHE